MQNLIPAWRLGLMSSFITLLPVNQSAEFSQPPSIDLAIRCDISLKRFVLMNIKIGCCRSWLEKGLPGIIEARHASSYADRVSKCSRSRGFPLERPALPYLYIAHTLL